MRHRLALQALTETKDSFGQMVPSWTTVATVWGLLEPLGGRELVNARQVMAEVSAKFTTRWQGSLAILPSMQGVFEGDTYRVVDVIDVAMRHKTLEIHLTKVVVPTP